MCRKETVRLVSRALSVIYCVFAFCETSYLPERLFSYLHYTNQLRSAGSRHVSLYFPSLYRVFVGPLFFPIAIYLSLAMIFWNCAPWVERILLAERES